LCRRYAETVCTAGVRDDGRPIRLYPVPLRYLSEGQHYRLYDSIDVPVLKSTSDSRPESFKVDSNSIACVGHIDTDAKGWAERARWIFADSSWQFANMGDLKAAEERTQQSLGTIIPGEIVGVRLEAKPATAEREYAERMAEVQAQRDIFLPEYKELEFRRYDIKLRWRCDGLCRECARQPHDMQVLDWGLIELARKRGWDWGAAKAKLEDIVNADRYDFRLFLGNSKAHRKGFMVVGLWYPRRVAEPPQLALL
jgi:hypothetical protein